MTIFQMLKLVSLILVKLQHKKSTNHETNREIKENKYVEYVSFLFLRSCRPISDQIRSVYLTPILLL